MKIIIAGSGEVGFYLAKMLSKEDHDLIVIDTDREVLNLVQSNLDLITIEGSATSIQTLKDAGAETCDLLIAVTKEETMNITIAGIAKQLGAQNTIARVDNPEFLDTHTGVDLHHMGVDSMIYPSELVLTEVVWLVKQATATNAFEFGEGRLTLLGIKIEKRAPIADKTVIEIAKMYSHFHFRIVALVRNDKTIIPGGNDNILAGDQLFIIVESEETDEIIKFSGRKKLVIKNIMILGGGRLGFKAAKRMQNEFSLKLIELNKDKTERLADELPNTLVLHGDGRNKDTLTEVGIDGTDAFISVTGDTETNILACIAAKKLGVRKTIALVENIDYIQLSKDLGIDTVINKKLIVASYIFRFIRKGEIVSLTNISGADAEIFEYVVKPGTRITQKPIKDLGFPRNALIGGVSRNGHSFIPIGTSVVEPGDQVVVFCLPEAISEVERFFN